MGGRIFIITREGLKEELRRLERENTIPEEDRKLFREYVSFLEAQGLSNGRLAKAAYQLGTLRKHLGCDFASVGKLTSSGLLYG